MITPPITLITTGGTIGSSSESESVNVTQGEKQLQQHIKDVCQRHNVTLKARAAFNKNSEDLTPLDWLTLIQVVKEEINNGCDKIIITHGTDTMPYSAAAIALCFRKSPVKIIFTGSCFTLDHPNSDVSVNLLGAFAAVTEAQISNGVYLSFLNSDHRTQVIQALDIKPMAFDELAFRAAFNLPHGVFSSQQDNYQANTFSNRPQPIDTSIDFDKITAQSLQAATQSVAQLSCYPGMNATQLCAGLKAGCCVIISLYHSGTGPSQAEEHSLLEAIRSRTDLTFLLSPLPKRYIEKPYSASITLLRAGAHLYQDIQPHILYVLITLGLASGKTLEELLTAVKTHHQPLPTS